MRISLYTATNNLAELLDQVDPDTGELPEGLDFAQIVFDKKAEAVVAYILEVRSIVASIKAREVELWERRQVMQNRVGWLEKYLSKNMAQLGIKKIAASDNTFEAVLYVGRDECLQVNDETKIPAQYMREKVSFEPRKTEIKAALKRGEKVPGVEIYKGDRLTIKG